MPTKLNLINIEDVRINTEFLLRWYNILTIIHNQKKQKYQEDQIFANILITYDNIQTKGQH